MLLLDPFPGNNSQFISVTASTEDDCGPAKLFHVTFHSLFGPYGTMVL